MNPVINIFSYRDVSDPEDVFILHYRKGGVIDACVADGVSGFHSPRVPNRWFRNDAGGRLTGGQVVGKILQGRFLNPPEEDSLADILLKANADMAAFASVFDGYSSFQRPPLAEPRLHSNLPAKTVP